MPIPVLYQSLPSPDPIIGDYAPLLTLHRDTLTEALTETRGWIVLAGVEGLDDPPRSLIDVEPSTWDGSMPTGARYQPRDVFIPLFYSAKSTRELRDTVRRMASLLDVKRGPVTLRLSHADGTIREINGRLAAPLSPAAFSQSEGSLWRKLGVTLRCSDPFWHGEQRSQTFSLGDPLPFLSDTFLPVTISESQVTGGTLITNAGDADAYPVWTLVGPCDSATITMHDTLFTVNDLTEGQTLVVDTRRGYQSVMLDDALAWGRLAQGAKLGALPPGDSFMSLTISGAGEGTELSMQWQERWLTAW